MSLQQLLDSFRVEWILARRREKVVIIAELIAILVAVVITVRLAMTALT